MEEFNRLVASLEDNSPYHYLSDVVDNGQTIEDFKTVEGEEKNLVFVYIEWIDSQGCSPLWEDISDYKPELGVHKSIGWIIHEDEVSISFSGTIADETSTSCYQANGINIRAMVLFRLYQTIDNTGTL